MRATNHALTGAIIGLTVGNPVAALGAAFVSHFICDIIPHYEDPRIIPGSKDQVTLLLTDCVGAIGVATFLFVLRPEAWFLACWCAFFATSPDLMWIPKFKTSLRTKKDTPSKNLITKFHSRIQWFQRPIGAVVEFAWAAGALILLAKLVVI